MKAAKNAVHALGLQEVFPDVEKVCDAARLGCTVWEGRGGTRGRGRGSLCERGRGRVLLPSLGEAHTAGHEWSSKQLASHLIWPLAAQGSWIQILLFHA